MNTVTLVSIVIPVFNRLDLLETTLTSVKNQTYQNYEVILIDDASEIDINFTGLIKKFNFSIFKYERLSENIGPGGARRRGRELARGEYITYLDSDDEWREDFLEQTIDVLKLHPHLSMVFTGCLTKKGDEIFKKTNIKAGFHDYQDLVFKQKKSWATGAGVWRTSISKAENWKAFRDHEDFVHDILSTSLFWHIYHIPKYLFIVHKNESRGIKRSNEEMLQAFRYLLMNVQLKRRLKTRKMSVEFSSFVLFKMRKRKYTNNNILDLIAIFLALFKLGNHKDLSYSFIQVFRKALSELKSA